MHYGIHDLIYGSVATIPLKVFQRRQPRPDFRPYGDNYTVVLSKDSPRSELYLVW